MKNLLSDIKLSLLFVVILGLLYPLTFVLVGKAVPDLAAGKPVVRAGVVVGYENVGQSFYSDKYFHGRPSAERYNAAATGGSNKGPSNPAYLLEVAARRDTLLAHNPGLKASQIPSEWVTASGSGIDPHISPATAELQVARIARARQLTETQVKEVIDQLTEYPLLGIWGQARVNVLQLNLTLDERFS